MGPKKGKKSKAELEAEKLAREEEERKEAAALEKRLQEEAEKKRLEEARIKEERKKFRIAELERLSLEYADLLDKLSVKDSERLAQENYQNVQDEWKKFRDPTDEPDARSDSDMNTFITLLHESTVHDFASCVDQLKRIEKVAYTMEEVWSDALAAGNSKVVAKSHDYLVKFANLCYEFIDAATISCLRFVDNYINDRYEIQLEESAGDMCVGIWASYADMRPIRKAVEFEKMGVKLDLPKQILQQEARFAHRIIKMPIDTFSRVFGGSDGAVHSQFILGDIYLFDIIISPPQAFSIRAKKWTIRDSSNSSTKVRKSAYPTQVASRCFMKVPENIIMSDDVRVMLWDNELKTWTEDGLSDFQYTEANRTAQFYMTVVGPIAFVKSKIIDLPYKRWSLQPIRAPDSHKKAWGEACTRFSVTTQKTEVVIDVIGTACKLVRPNTKTFSDILDVEMSPGQLVSKLLKKGINLRPTYEEAQRMEDNTLKNPDLEDDVLFAISRCASACEFQSSSWNKSLDASRIGILVRESTLYTGGNDTYDYECVYAEMDSASETHLNAPDAGSAPGKAGVKYVLVYGNEYGDKKDYSLEPRPNEISHVDFTTSLANRLTADANERIARGNERFHVTVNTLLKLVKPFSF